MYFFIFFFVFRLLFLENYLSILYYQSSLTSCWQTTAREVVGLACPALLVVYLHYASGAFLAYDGVKDAHRGGKVYCGVERPTIV